MKIDKRNNYLAFSDMLLTITMLSNEFNDELERDSYEIIKFIGEVFSLSENEKEDSKNLITDELTRISTIDDVEAYQNYKKIDELNKIDSFLYLKTVAISTLENIYQHFSNDAFNQYFFNYHYLRPYYPSIRFHELTTSAIKGNVDINRTLAIMLALGIGHEKDTRSAIYHFLQCAYWGDITSLYYLAYLYKKTGKKEETKLYEDLIELMNFALEGRTVLPSKIKNKYSKKSQECFALIASIKQDIVLAKNISNINFSFLEVIFSDNIDYYDKIGYINRYSYEEWKEITNSSSNPKKKLGFRVKGDN